MLFFVVISQIFFMTASVNSKLRTGYVPKSVPSNINNDVDPNTTFLPVVRTTHANCPIANATFIIYTSVTDSDIEASERRQIAIECVTNTPHIYIRAKPWGLAWGEWLIIATHTDTNNVN